jgi:hypothetical protein
VVGVGADHAGLGEFQAGEMFGLIGGDVVGGDGHNADAVAALDLEFLDGLEVNFAVGGFLAHQASLRKGAMR